jgi:hypothetical protein
LLSPLKRNQIGVGLVPDDRGPAQTAIRKRGQFTQAGSVEPFK